MIGDILNGLAFGGLLFILASGFSLALGVIRVINIAHGAFYMLSAYLAITVARETGSFLLSIATGAIALMILAGVIERLLLQRFGLDPLPQVLSTYGITLIIVEVSRHIWDGRPLIGPTPEYLDGSLTVAGSILPGYRAFLIVAATFLAVLLWWLIERTSVGALVRASVDDEEIARSIGINVDWLFMGVFAFVGLLAGLGGALGSPLLGSYQGVEFEVLTLTLVVVVIGGVGSIRGAVMGSIFVGVIDSVGKVNLPEFSFLVLFAPMVLILSIRPTGLLGQKASISS